MIKYYCDRCEKQCPKPYKIELKVDYANSVDYSRKTPELCEDCRELFFTNWKSWMQLKD